MKSTLKNKGFIAGALNLVAFFVFVLFGVSCTDEHYGEGQKTEPNPPIIQGDTIISFDKDFKLHHDSWTTSDGLVKADNYFDGYINYLVDGDVVKTLLIDHQIAPVEFVWTPMEETTGSAPEMPYIGHTEGEAKKIDSGKNQILDLAKYERELKISFVGAELPVKVTFWGASLGKTAKVCWPDSITVATQYKDTVKVNGNPIEVVVEGNKFNRVIVTAKCLMHFTDISGDVKTSHSDPLDIVYPRLVPVEFTPGEKIYEGSTGDEKTGVYTFVDRSVEGSIIITRFKSQMELEHYESQDGNLQKSKTTESGIAISKYWVEEKGPKLNLLKMFSGNPIPSFESSVSDLYLKEGFIYAKKYTTVWTYRWDEFNYEKKVYNETEVLYYMREKGKEVAMPFGEATTSWKEYVAGTSTEKSEGNKKYDAYPNGVLYFNGLHTSKTGNLKHQIEGLQVGQEFWVEKEEPKDELINWDYDVTYDPDTKTSTITITENWSESGKKTVVKTLQGDFTFTVSGAQRFFGSNLDFVSGPSLTSDSPEFKLQGDNYVRTVTTTTSVELNYGAVCYAKAISSQKEGYIIYRDKRIDYKFDKANVEYKGLNNPTPTEVEEGLNKYSRKDYRVTFKHNILGEKAATIYLDKLIPVKPDMPDEMGPVDIAKTTQFGRLSWAWDASGKEFVSGTIVTAYGVVSFWNGGYCFTKMTTAEIKDRLGNSLCPENSANYLIPAYITIENKPNKHWVYTDVNGKGRDEIYGTLIEKLEDVSLNEPFFGTPSETSETYQIIDQEGSTRIRVVYKGTVLFDHVFAK